MERAVLAAAETEGGGAVPILLIEGPLPEDERARHTIEDVEVRCIRNSVFVIHTTNMDDSVHTIMQTAKNVSKWEH